MYSTKWDNKNQEPFQNKQGEESNNSAKKVNIFVREGFLHLKINKIEEFYSYKNFIEMNKEFRAFSSVEEICSFFKSNRPILETKGNKIVSLKFLGGGIIFPTRTNSFFSINNFFENIYHQLSEPQKEGYFSKKTQNTKQNKIIYSKDKKRKISPYKIKKEEKKNKYKIEKKPRKEEYRYEQSSDFEGIAMKRIFDEKYMEEMIYKK